LAKTFAQQLGMPVYTLVSDDVETRRGGSLWRDLSDEVSARRSSLKLADVR